MDWVKLIPFKQLVEFFEKFVCTKKSERIKVVQRFLEHCRSQLEAAGQPGDSLYPIVRLLAPSLDKERGYKIKETVLASMYIDFLQLGKKSEDALKLMKYRDPSTAQDDAGDLASVLWRVLQQRSCQATDITCAEINEKLDLIAKLSNSGGRAKVKHVLKDLFLKMDSVQQKWFVRILLKNIKVLGHKTLLSVIHRDANEYYQINSNLRKLCELSRDPSVRLNEYGIQMFSPFMPQLADRIDSINEVAGFFKENKFCYLDLKYDGERLQAHLEPGQARLFSRRGNDFTDEYGPKFAGEIAASLAPTVRSVILDGEACAWNRHTRKITQKGLKQEIRRIPEDDPGWKKCMVVYDICYLNGKALINLPLTERMRIYKDVITPTPGSVEFASRSIVHDKAEVVNALNQAIDDQEEGLVLKVPSALYKPNARTKSGWVKLKPEYEKTLSDTLDLLVLGGCHGKAGQINVFILGLADRSDPENTVYVTFCRVSGCSANMLSKILRQCGPEANEPDPAIRRGKEEPNVWFEPKTAAVVEVVAAEIIKSNSYSAGCTLRFPRIESLRTDKDSSNCTSVHEMNKIGGIGSKLFGRVHLSHNDDATTSAPPRKRAKLSAQRRRPNLGEAFLHKDYTNERVETHQLKDKVVVVEPCLDVALKHQCERIIVKHGGKIEQNVRHGITSFYVETAGTAKSANIVGEGRLDVVKSSWVLQCDQQFRRFGPQDVVFATEKTRQAWKNMYDEFGDGYREPATALSLAWSLGQVSRKNLASCDSTLYLEEQLGSSYKYHLFKGLTMYLDYPAEEENDRFMDAALARFYGAEVVEELGTDNRISHIVLSQPHQHKLAEYKEMRRTLLSQNKKLFKLVTQDWLIQSVQQSQVEKEINYIPDISSH